ncbi:MAG: branched-chain amino acid ABC transporter permease [Patescibacteria group bacterium]
MEYLLHLFILISICAILGISLNLILGYTGLLSITHAAFYGIGAYATAVMMVTHSFPFFPSLLAGLVLSGIFALGIGSILSRFSGDYFALGSFGFNIIVSSLFINLQGLTGGPLGISGIDRPSFFGFVFSDRLAFLALAIFFVVMIYLLSQWIVRSSFGRTLKAIREDEKVVQVFGYKTLHYKLAIFVIGAMMASVAGALFASYSSYIDPSTFDLTGSIFVLAVIVLGGLANTKGAVFGAIFLVLLPEIFRFVGFPSALAAELRQVAYGLTLVLLMLYRPQGFIGAYKF